MFPYVSIVLFLSHAIFDVRLWLPEWRKDRSSVSFIHSKSDTLHEFLKILQIRSCGECRLTFSIDSVVCIYSNGLYGCRTTPPGLQIFDYLCNLFLTLISKSVNIVARKQVGIIWNLDYGSDMNTIPIA